MTTGDDSSGPTLAAGSGGDLGSDPTVAPEGELGSQPTVASGGGASRPAPSGDALPEISRATYAVRRELARGGMGRILLAEDRRLGRQVAPKERPPRTPG